MDAKFSDSDFSAARLLKEELEQAELGDEDEDFMGRAAEKGDIELAIQQSIRDQEESKEEQKIEPQRSTMFKPLPLYPQAEPSGQYSYSPSPPLSPSPPIIEESPPPLSPSPPSSPSIEEEQQQDEAYIPPQSAKKKVRIKLPAAEPRRSTRATRGMPAPRYGMVDYGREIGSQHATIRELESIAEAAAFNGEMDEDDESDEGSPLPRGSSPTQEYERRKAIDAEENDQPFPPDRKRCNKRGEIVVSTRCTKIKKDGSQCGARTRNTSRCWNHLKSDMGLRIKQSNIIHGGKGLFAERPYARGEEVSKYTGDQSNDPEVEHGGSNYVVGLSRDVTIDAARTNTAPGRMVNDSRGSRFQPNTTFVIDQIAKKVRLKTTKAVAKGEEFFVPYGRGYWLQQAALKKKKLHFAKKSGLPEPPKKKKQLKRKLKDIIAANLAEKQFAADPTTFKQAMGANDKEDWLKAIAKEQQSLIDRGVYTTVDKLPAGAKLLTSKWVFKRKRNNDGTVQVRKARVVARGFMQREGVDYDETYSGVMQYQTIRAMTAIAATTGRELKIMDVETAFLNAPLDRVLYMKAPEGFTGVPPGAILQLNKALYGLHQSGKLWNGTLVSKLLAIGYKQCSNSDLCLFVRTLANGRQLIIGVFVDDMPYLFDQRDLAEMESDKSKLMSSFKIKDLGDATSILGMRITRDRVEGTIHMDQAQLIFKSIEGFGLTNLKAMLTPEPVSVSRSSASASTAQLSSDAETSDEDEEEEKLTLQNYRSGVGVLGYLAGATRPDIAHAYNMCARAQSAPTQQDLKNLIQIFRYLAGTAELGLHYSRRGNGVVKMIAFSDADWAGSKADAKSTTGMILKLGGAAFSWVCQKQTSVAMSSTEAEYIAASETTREIIHARVLLADMGFAQPSPTPLLIDNQTAIRMALEDGNAQRRKHINVKHHFVREKVAERMIELKWVPTAEQEADIMTKATARQQFFHIRALVMGLNKE